MSDESFKLTTRSCDALLLAYNPSEKLGGSFYIPSTGNCEEAYGNALREIYGTKTGNTHWADRVKWNRIKNLNQLESRILKGTEEAVISEADYASQFEMHLTLSQNFLSQFFYGRGELYKFEEEKREKTLKDFEKFWNEKEKAQWKEIHQDMREYTLEEFRKK